MADIGQWQPAQGAHAIQMAAVGINLREPITSYVLDQIIQKIAPIAAGQGLVEQIPQHEAVFMMIPGQVQPPMPMAGCEFLKRERPDFFSDKFTVGKSNLRYEDWSYTRWAVTAEKIAGLVEPILQDYTNSALIGDIYVEYVDVFTTPGDSTDAASLIIKDGSPFVARTAAEKGSEWHTHSGYFEHPETEGRRLLQVNVDRVNGNAPDGTPRRIVQIRTYASDQANDPSQPPSGHLNKPWTTVADRLQILHDCAKENFRAVLTEEAALAVSLG